MHPTSLHIGSETSRLEIAVLQRHDGVAWMIALTLTEGPHLSAYVERAHLIPEAGEAVSLTTFLGEMGELYWTGWPGDRSWQSLEGNLTIVARWRRLGGAEFRIGLRPEGQRWRVEGTVEVDDMELAGLGASARAVLLSAGET